MDSMHHPQVQPQYRARMDKHPAAHPLAFQSSSSMSASSRMIHVVFSISFLSSMKHWPEEAVMKSAVCEGMG